MTPEQCASMGEMMGGMMGQMMGGGMMGGWGGVACFGLLLVVIIAVGIVLAVALIRRPAGAAADDPREILRRRFARGEISADEFASAMKTLG